MKGRLKAISYQSLLDVRELSVETKSGSVGLVRGVSFSVERGETVALVGESGSGKSLTAKAIAGLLPSNLRASGSVVWKGQNVLPLRERRKRRFRGADMSMLLQDPFSMLNPLTTVERSLGETLEGNRSDRRGDATRLLSEVGLDPGALPMYPWELSGGMRQRVGIASALTQSPLLLLADEPTTALDATTQREVLSLISKMQQDRDMALIIITHDLRVAMAMSDRIIVMCEGAVVETGTPDDLIDGGKEAYTQKLWAAELPVDRRLGYLRPDPDDARHKPPVTGRFENVRTSVSSPNAALVAHDLRKTYRRPPSGRSTTDVAALDGVTVELRTGTSLGILGESGSGKTTLARCLLGLEHQDSGDIQIFGAPQSALGTSRAVQCVFQDPYASLNPTHSIGFTLSEAVRHREAKVSSPQVTDEIAEMLEGVGLAAEMARRKPDALSGGQRQRVAIARALLMKPRILVCDEPVAALDLTVQAQVLQVLRDSLQQGLSMVFITHDVSVARQMTDDLVVLWRGQVVESGRTESILRSPQHPYTQRLLAAVPTADRGWLGVDRAQSVAERSQGV